MNTKIYARFLTRMDYFDCDTELVDVFVRNNDKLEGNDIIFMGITQDTHPILFKRQNSHESREIVVKHLRSTVYSAYLKDIYEEAILYFQDLLNLFANYDKDAKRILGSDKVEIEVMFILEHKDINQIILNAVNKIFRQLENQRDSGHLIKEMNKRLKLNVPDAIIDDAVPYFEIRHLLVHNDGFSDDKFRNDYSDIQLDEDGKIILTKDLTQKAKFVINNLIKEFDTKIIEMNILPETEMHP